MQALPLELAIAALQPSPPFNANTMGACLRHVCSLTLCASKWGGRNKKFSEINPGDSAEILASNVFFLALQDDGIWLIRQCQCYEDFV